MRANAEGGAGDAGASSWSPPDLYYNLAVLFALLLGVSLYAVMFTRHLRSWTRPYMNVAYLRIYLLAAVYLVLAVCSFLETETYDWTAVFRSWYEAYAFYVFSAMLMAAYGGEQAMEELWESQSRDPTLKRWVPERPCGLTRGRWVHWSLLQYQIVQPFTALLVAILNQLGKSSRVSAFLLRVVGVTSLVIALRTLLQVYMTLHKFVDNLNAVSKVLWFKTLVAAVVLEEAIFNVLQQFSVFSPTPSFTARQVAIRTISVLVTVEAVVWLIAGAFLFGPSDPALSPTSRQSRGHSGSVSASRSARLALFLSLWTVCAGGWSERSGRDGSSSEGRHSEVEDDPAENAPLLPAKNA